jgi:hypothetical protein
MKYLKLALACALASVFSSCASMQGAEVADYNRDGVISDAESRQYQKQANVQQTNVVTERMKMEHGTESLRNVRDGVGAASDTVNTLRNFGRGYGRGGYGGWGYF